MRGALAVLCCLMFLNLPASGKVFTRCDLARELIRQGFPMEHLRNWICLIEAESERNTKYKSGPRKNGSFNLGLFQINDLIYCDKYARGGECNILCDDLLTDDISIAGRCAFLIHKYNGFGLWKEWTDKCQDTLPSIDKCGLKHVKPNPKSKNFRLG